MIEKILINRHKIKARVKELAAEIEKDYKNKTPLLVAILKGSVIFYADLVREIKISVHFDFMAVSSYGQSSKTSGEVKILKDLDYSIEGRDAIIVEDIVDSGITLCYLKEILQSRKPRSIKICTLLDKAGARIQDIKIDYTGFEIGDEFVVGYGLDYAQDYRNLPDICVLKKSALKT